MLGSDYNKTISIDRPNQSQLCSLISNHLTEVALRFCKPFKHEVHRVSQNQSGQRDPLQADGWTDRRYWIREDVAIVGIGDTGEELGQMATEVKIAFPMSHNFLTIVEEYVQ
jgi:hypothetical protein